MADWVVYILRCADHTLYTGITTDLPARIASHHAGRGAKYLRGRLPAVLVYSEAALDHAAALRREHAIKRLDVQAKRRLISATLPPSVGGIVAEPVPNALRAAAPLVPSLDGE